ncbi:MAG: alkaline phosphatase family protein [Candidatus Binatales bacterium]
MRELSPERLTGLTGQGLDPNQFESGDRTILALLNEPPACDQVDLVATMRAGAYEVWSRRGMVRFTRHLDDRGELHFEVIEQINENPIENQDPFAIATIEQELAAAHASGNPVDDPNFAYIEPAALTHPYAYERIAQVFDSPRGPDLIVSPKCYAFGIQPGQHGALDIVQSRAPLMFAGPGVKQGQHRIASRHVDIAPTIARLMGFPEIEGFDHSGRASSAVYMKRQDGRVLDEIIEPAGEPAGDPAGRAAAVYMILLDGLSNSELKHQLALDPIEIPNLAWIAERSAFMSHGSTVNFPSITWPSHTAILTGAWSGHHDIVNPTFYERATRETIPVQGSIFETERFVSLEVETLYEAFKRVHGPGAVTASIHEPQGRGADHAAFERRIMGDKARLKALTAEMVHDVSPRWAAGVKPAMEREEIVDIRGIAQVIGLFEHCGDDAPPVFVAHEFVLTDGAGHDYGPHHEGMREALVRTDRRIGIVLDLLRRRGLLDSTLFVVTSDHGMAAQRIELKANPTVAPAKHGIKAIFAEPMIYLRDLALELDRTRDGRNLRITVLDNDPAVDGERPPVEGARVTILEGERPIGEGYTSRDGTIAFATPAHLSDGQFSIRVEHEKFNSRNIRGDGSPIDIDLRGILYGSHRD